VVDGFADVTSSGRLFHVCGPAIGKARLPAVDSLLNPVAWPDLYSCEQKVNIGRSVFKKRATFLDKFLNV